MAWSWSHTGEAYDIARQNLHAFGLKRLQVMFAEWHSLEDPLAGSASCLNMDMERYGQALQEAKKLPADVLADYIWEQMEQLATCTNGGWEAWGCPFGCGPHLVPFSTFAERMAEAKEAKARRKKYS